MNMGEAIKSLRQVLQRHSLARSISMGDTTAAGYWAVWKMKFGRMPAVNGYDVGAGMGTARNQANTATVSYNWVSKHPLPYVTAMFRGYRGGINHQYLIRNDRGNDLYGFRIMRYGGSRFAADANGSWNYSVAAPNANQSASFLNTSFVWEGTGGQNVTNPLVNNGLSSLLPDFNMANFNLFSPNILVEGASDDFSYHNTYGMQTTVPINATIVPYSGTVLQQHIAMGVDFTPVFFLCAPTLDVYGGTPIAP